jgi:hypothetical protein
MIHKSDPVDRDWNGLTQGGDPMKTTCKIIMTGLLVFAFLGPAFAERYVVVNGQRLSIPEIQYLERLHCGPVPNGQYWINLRTGQWGYTGNPWPQGYVGDNCRNTQRRPSLSERGKLFSPSDWIR